MKKLPTDILVTIVAVVLILLAGGGGYYWFATQLGTQQEALNTVVKQLNDLAQEKITPSEQNKTKAVQNSKQAEIILSRIYPFLSDSDPLFDSWRVVRGTKTTPTKGLDPLPWQRSFNNIRQDVLQPLVTENKVHLPKPFYYSFDEFIHTVPAADKTFDLGVELEAIKELSTILFTQKIHELTSVRRVLVENKGTANGGIGLDARILDGPDQLYRVYPLQIQFRCTPAELISVINAIHSDKMLFVVRYVSVVNDKQTVPTQTDLESLVSGPPLPPGDPHAAFGQPGMMPPPGVLPPSPDGTPATPVSKKIFIVVAGEEYINVTIWVDLLLWNGPQPSNKNATSSEATAPATPQP